MKNDSGVDIALIHHPVVNKTGEIIGSAVTNLDIHDIARAARTYGVDNYYIVTPYEDQQELVAEILKHWKSGHGATYNPARKEALELVSIVPDVEKVVEMVSRRRGKAPLILTTSARKQDNTLTYGAARKKVREKEPLLLLFGTAHGLAQELMTMSACSLPPVGSGNDYNHLSVRSAVSIILDRLMGDN